VRISCIIITQDIVFILIHPVVINNTEIQAKYVFVFQCIGYVSIFTSDS